MAGREVLRQPSAHELSTSSSAAIRRHGCGLYMRSWATNTQRDSGSQERMTWFRRHTPVWWIVARWPHHLPRQDPLALDVAAGRFARPRHLVHIASYGTALSDPTARRK